MTKRRKIQLVLGLAIYYLVTIFQIPIGYVIIFGGFLGIIFGKVFCRWMCPIGIIMEFIMKRKGQDEKQSLYQYHKLGCPIAWISGYFNKTSLFKIKVDESKCIDCGKCDETCYITSIDQNFSLFKKEKYDPAKSFKCSRCLDCITECPVEAITFNKTS